MIPQDKSRLIDVVPHMGFEKSEVAANILKGFEDFTLNDAGTIISSNLEAVNVTGYEEWEVIGKHISMFYTQEDIKNGKVETDLQKAQLRKKHSYFSWKAKKRNVTFWAQMTFKCIRDENSNVVRYKVILKDQNHRLISDDKMQRLKNEYRSLFDNPFIGIFKFRLVDFKILLLNNKARQILEDRKIKKFDEIFQNRVELEWLMETLFKTKKAYAFEFQLGQTTEAWARLDCQLFEAEGFVEGVITDITESKKQLLKLEQLNADLDNFIYRASHDLRSPLTTLMGLINLVEVDKQIELSHYYKMMRDRISHLDHLLADLAAITYNNKAPLVLQPVNFKSVTQKLVNEFIEQASIHVSIYADDELGIHTDEQRVLTILRNITAHSVSYHNPVAPKHTIYISVVINNEKSQIKIRDNGRGIHDDQLLRIFGIFYKSTNEAKETGLGLYMTKLFIDKLLGHIHVSSTIGVGTEFEIMLPDLKRKQA